jgi:hypothetical protein
MQITKLCRSPMMTNLALGDGAWIVQYKEKAKRDIDTIQVNQKLNEIEFEEQVSISAKLPRRQILKTSENNESSENSQVGLLDGFYLVCENFEENLH